MIIDTHSHLNFDAFKDDFDEVMKRTLEQNIWIINVGTNYKTSQRSVEITEEYQSGVYSAIGFHPIYAASEFIKLKIDPNEGEFPLGNTFNKDQYKKLAQSKKVVAIGEVGLDYYYKPKTTAKLSYFKEKQKQVFLEQINLAEELNLPLILHCRMAHADLIEILRSKIKNKNAKLTGVVHCFTGTMEEMKEYIEMGFYIGLNGIIFKLPLDEIVKNCPLDKMLVETDCPYLTPIQEGQKRNEPIFIKHTIQRIAELKKVRFEEVCQKTTQNGKNLFRI